MNSETSSSNLWAKILRSFRKKQEQSKHSYSTQTRRPKANTKTYTKMQYTSRFRTRSQRSSLSQKSGRSLCFFETSEVFDSEIATDNKAQTRRPRANTETYTKIQQYTWRLQTRSQRSSLSQKSAKSLCFSETSEVFDSEIAKDNKDTSIDEDCIMSESQNLKVEPQLKRQHAESEQVENLEKKLKAYIFRAGIYKRDAVETKDIIERVHESVTSIKSQVLLELTISNCDLEKKHLEKLLNLDQSLCTIRKLVVKNGKSVGKLIPLLFEIYNKHNTACLSLESDNLGDADMKLFCSSVKEAEEFNVNYNSNLEEDTPKNFVSAMKKSGVKKLSMTRDKLNLISQISRPQGNDSFVNLIIEIAKNVDEIELEDLDISEMMLSADQLRSFRKALGNAKFQNLNLSDHTRYPDKEYVSEVCELLPHIKKTLVLEWDVFLDAFRPQLQKALDRIGSELQIVVNGEKGDILHTNPGGTFQECDEESLTTRIRALVKSIQRNKDHYLEKVEFSCCNVQRRHLEEFYHGIRKLPLQIGKLSIEYNRESVKDLISMCCQIVNRCQTFHLSLMFNKLTREDVATLCQDLVEGTKLDVLDVSYNHEICPKGFRQLGQIVKDHDVKILRAVNCDISAQELKQLFVGMSGGADERKNNRMLNELNISYSKNLGTEGLGYVGEFVRGKNVRILKLSGIHLTKESLRAFDEKLKKIERSATGEVLLEELDVSYNSTMKTEDYKILASMAKICRIKKLSLAGCGIDSEHLENLKEGITPHTMSSLDASDNFAIGDGIIVIAGIVKESNLEELDISDCMLSVHQLRDFRKALGNAKLQYLKLSDGERDPDKRYVEEVCALIPNIVKKIDLKWGILREQARLLLRQALERKNKGLQIVVNNDGSDILVCKVDQKVKEVTH